MAFDLPPRRELPADVKDLMRPEFTEAGHSSTGRGRAPLAVAAGVLLIAGGVAAAQFLTQPFIQQARPAHEGVVQPSGQDLARCRTALNDQSWQSTEMVEFGLHKVLAGRDNRFCELTRSRAFVASEGFRPVDLIEGSITYRSRQIIAGIPPSGARTAKSRIMPDKVIKEFQFSVVTPHFFIVVTELPDSNLTLLFDDRAMPMPGMPANPVTESESFESGDSDPWTPVNLTARCTDNANEYDGVSADELQGWEPLLVSGLDKRNGVLIAHREHEVWAACTFSPDLPHKTRWQQLRTITEKPEKPVLLSDYETKSEFTVVGRIKRSVDTVEVSTGDGPSVTADVVDGHFLAAIPVTGDEKTGYAERLHVVGRDSDNEVVYEGGFE